MEQQSSRAPDAPATFSTVTLSPALDVTLSCRKFPEPGDVITGFSEIETPGGKGLNAVRWLAMRGHPVVASGILGEEGAAPFESLLARYGIVDSLGRVPGPNRRNVMITSPGGMFKVNRQAFPHLRPEDWSLERILAPCLETAACVLAGSLPRAVPPAIYADLIAALRRAGVPAVLDTAGLPLALGLEAGPAVIKPNSVECGELLGATPKTPEDFRSACRTLLEKAECVLISDGPGGCWFAARALGGRILHGSAPPVKVVDTTAAGDTLLAEFCHRHFPGRGIDEDVIRHACAAGAAATEMPGAASPSLARVDALAGEVVVTSFEGSTKSTLA